MNYTGKSLEEVHASVDTIKHKSFWRKLFAFIGPAYLISVGYMDPGNWATDIAAGSHFGYTLLWVLLMSNIMALLLQSLSARLGIVRGLDLAQASKEYFPGFINVVLYFLAEIAIAACDLAEVLGMAIGLQLLFNLPLLAGVCLTLLDTFLLLFLINRGMRKMEAFILALVTLIGISFFIELFFAKPDLGRTVTGFIPHIANSDALYIAIGIIGATVMPHNLYLHSSLVQTRKIEQNDKSIKEAIRFNLIDSTIALNIAFFINAAILIVAAAAFFKSGMFDITEIKDAHKFLAPLLGTQLAPFLFALSLIAAGQSSTLTGTLAGQIVMEGYLNLRIQPWLRRMITRLFAITPAVLTIVFLGEQYLGQLLILSQVILSLQLGFAVVPLIHFVSDKKKMGKFVINNMIKFAAWLIAIVIIALNSSMVFSQIQKWMKNSAHPDLILIFIGGPAILIGMLLLYIIIIPFAKKVFRRVYFSPHRHVESFNYESQPEYTRIAIALDFAGNDNSTMNYALSIGGMQADYHLVHVVESAGAIFMGQDIRDYESDNDEKTLESYVLQLKDSGYSATYSVGFGNPRKIIPGIVKDFDADLVVMGSHGHRMLKDLILGTTIEAVRHELNIPVLIVKM